MSMRDFIIAVKSIEPIRATVGSNNESLFKELLASAENELDDFGDDPEEAHEQRTEIENQLRRMILTNPPLEEEPGCWIFLIKQIVPKLKLSVSLNLEFNKGYKHAYAWPLYRRLISSRLTSEARISLQQLDEGRPLRGKQLEQDGTQFAWLTHPEIVALHNSLSQITTDDLGNIDLDEFHEDLVDALSRVRKRCCDLILGAH